MQVMGVVVGVLGWNVYIVVNEVMSVNGVGLIVIYNRMW